MNQEIQEKRILSLHGSGVMSQNVKCSFNGHMVALSAPHLSSSLAHGQNLHQI